MAGKCRLEVNFEIELVKERKAYIAVRVKIETTQSRCDEHLLLDIIAGINQWKWNSGWR